MNELMKAMDDITAKSNEISKIVKLPYITDFTERFRGLNKILYALLIFAPAHVNNSEEEQASGDSVIIL